MKVSASTLAETRVPPGRRGESLSMSLTYAARSTSAAGAIVSSPLPFLGGDMQNNVVRTLAETLARCGLVALRYDYRSVGDSHDVVPGEARYETWRRIEESGDRSSLAVDADEALARARRLFRPVLLAGYSFGCWSALRMAAELTSATPLVLVAPPFARVDLSAAASHAGPVLVVVAGADALAPPPPLHELRRDLPHAHIVVLRGADHFLRGREDDLAAIVHGFVADALRAPRSPEAVA